MADISKCEGRDCPQKETCYRYTAESNEYWQAWSDFDLRREGECNFYWLRKGD